MPTFFWNPFIYFYSALYVNYTFEGAINPLKKTQPELCLDLSRVMYWCIRTERYSKKHPDDQHDCPEYEETY